MKRIILIACSLLILVACTSRRESESLVETSTAAALEITQQVAQLQTEFASTLTAVAPAFATNTARPTAAPTNTARPSNTPRPSSTPGPSETSSPSLLALQLTSNALTPHNTPRPTEVDTDTYYVTASTANVRACATSTTSCNVLTALSYGDDIEVIESVEGVSVAGSTRWYHVLLNDGRDGYVHSSLISRTRPVAGSPSGGNSSNSGGSTSSSSSSGNSSGSNPQPTQAPQIQPTQPPALGYTCDCNKTCGSMTCDEAYYQLNTCGCGARDNDNDGVPCESVCSGG